MISWNCQDRKTDQDGCSFQPQPGSEILGQTGRFETETSTWQPLNLANE
jgi:hypothetical protein